MQVGGVTATTMYKVADTTLTLDVTQVDFTSLGFGTTYPFMLITMVLREATGGASEISAYVAGDYTAANYTSQYGYFQNAGAGAAYYNNKSYVGTLSASGETFVTCWLSRTPAGYTRMVVQSNAGANLVEYASIAWTGTSAWGNLRIAASVANAIKAGSRIVVWGFK